MQIYYSIIILLFITAFIIYKFSFKNKTSDIIDENNDNNLVPWEIEVCDDLALAKYEQPQTILLTDDLKRHIFDIVKIMPSAADIVQKEKKLIIKFKPEVLEKLKSGELTIMKKKNSLGEYRLIAIDTGKKTRSHGWIAIKDVKKVNPMQLMNAVFGVMTIITAQEHLDKINKQLTQINEKIDTLLKQYNNDKIGKIQGSISYLKSIRPAYEKMNASDNQMYLTKIEDIMHQCYMEINSVLPTLKNEINAVGNLKVTAIYKIDDIINEIEGRINSFEQNMQIYYGNYEVMLICINICNDLGGQVDVNKYRLSDIDEDHNKLINLHKEFDCALTKRMQELNVTFRTNATIAKNQEKLKQMLSFLNDKVQCNNDDLVKKIAHNGNPTLNEQIDLQVLLDDEDKPSEVYALKQSL